MKLGAFYGQLIAGVREKGMDLNTSLATARAHGITCADLAASDFIKISAKEFAALLASHDIEVASTHDSYLLDYATREGIEKTIESVKQHMCDAQSIGCPYFMLVPQPPKYHSEDRHAEFEDACRETFARLTAYGKEIGIQATVENYSLWEHPYTTFADFDWIFANIPDVMYTYDSGNFPLADFDEIEGLKRYLDKTVYVHLKDLEITKDQGIVRRGVYYEGPALGDGFVKNDEAVRILAANGYDGCLTIEICSGIDVYDKLLKSADVYAEKLKSL